MLAHPAGEGEHVESSQGGGHLGDEAAEPMHVHIPGEDRLCVAGARAGEHLAHVGGTGQCQQPGAMLEGVRELVDLEAAVLEQPQEQPRIDGSSASPSRDPPPA